MLIALISALVHEIGVIMLDLLLLPSLTHNISSQHKHIASAGTENGKSFRPLQVR
jgi:hypothetical protein